MIQQNHNTLSHTEIHDLMKRIAAPIAACLLALHAGFPTEAGQFGTGFAVSPKGYLITCHHVIQDAERIVVHVNGGYLDGSVVALDPPNDLALLKVDHWPARYLTLVSTSDVTYASQVLVAGFPDPGVLGINPKVSTGIVNALSGVHDDPRYIQISAPVQPGNSGGPLLSPSGRVVGVVASGLNSIDRMEHGGYLPQSVNYALKSDLVTALLKKASVSVPRFGGKVAVGPKQIERTLESIALIEGLSRGEKMYIRSAPLTVAPPSRAVDRPAISRPLSSPWIFPDSSTRPLSISEVQSQPKDRLWQARNEIYVRHGFIFPSEEGRRFAARFGRYYRPATPSVEAIKQRLTPVEIANLRLIADFE